jgi:hypothetical protein
MFLQNYDIKNNVVQKEHLEWQNQDLWTSVIHKKQNTGKIGQN